MGRRGIFYGWTNVALFFFIAVMMWGPQYSFGVFFKSLASEFDWSRAETSVAMTMNLVVGGSLGFLFGGLSDRYGPQKVMSLSAIFIGTGYLFLSRLSASWQLYLWFGLIVGIGMSSAYIVPAASISRWFIRKRGIALGITLMGMSFSQIFIPPLLALMIGWTGWRNSYAFIGAATLAVVLALAAFLKKSPEEAGLLPDGDKEPPVTSGFSGVVDGFTLKQSARFPAFWMVFVLWICLSIPVFLAIVHVVPLATDVGIGPVEAAVILSFIGASGIGGRIVFGSMCDRWGCRPSAAIGMALVGLSALGLTMVRTPLGFYVAGTVFGFGYTGADTALVKLTGDFFGRRFIGSVMGALGLGWRIGAGVGAVIGGIIFDLTRIYQASFVLASLCAAVGTILVFVIFHYKPEAKSAPSG
ncbi:MAG: MFS transporter [Chloroflexi bacterium]|nr:MFS transporter [Chloroflexota bacterium]